MLYYPLSKVTEEAEVLSTVFHILWNVFVQKGQKGISQTVHSWVREVQRTLQSFLKDGRNNYSHFSHAALQQTNPIKEETEVMICLATKTHQSILPKLAHISYLNRCLLSDNLSCLL